MSNVLIDSIIDKVNAQENIIKEMSDTIKKVSGHPQEIDQIKKDLGQLSGVLKDLKFPVGLMSDLSVKVSSLNNQLDQPVKNIVQHHHHFPKIIWVTIVLLVGLITVCTGWYMTASTSQEYVSNDTKYRYLKLIDNKALQQLLYHTDSVYRFNPGLRDSIIQKEEENRIALDLLQKAIKMEKEAENLKRKAKGYQ